MMKTNLSSLFENFLAKINWYTELLTKICEPLRSEGRRGAKDCIDTICRPFSPAEKPQEKDDKRGWLQYHICEKLSDAEKSEVQRVLRTMYLSFSGERSRIRKALIRACKPLSASERNELISLFTTISEPLTNPEIFEVYESFVLKICCTWEIFAEDLLASCLSKDVSLYSEYMGLRLPKRSSKELCVTLITGYGFFDFKSIGGLKRISKNILLPAYDPFQHIPKYESKKIDEFSIIRNYVAHRSRKSKRSLTRLYNETYDLPRFQEPGMFLVSPIHERNKETMFGEYIRAFTNTAIVMADFLRV